MSESMEMPVCDTAPQVEQTKSISTGGAPVGDDATRNTDGADTTPPPVEGETASTKDGDIVYRFNHETRTLSSADAPNFIQKLLKSQYDYEHKVVPHLDRLRALAGEADGDLGAVVEKLEQVCDEAEYRDFLEKSGGNEEIARGLQEAARRMRNAGATTTAAWEEKQVVAARDALTQRMGEELRQLQEEFPEIRELSDLPPDVVNEASEQQVPLLFGYLRYLYRNSRNAAVQRDAEEKAAAASVGSLRGEAESVGRKDDQSAAFSSAFRKRFL
ncbi:MAG: hypothetical protein E7552_02605 [Ruminococcaceae bacterium]|nr:hypothetical protein [Oscillospiraceae bacterium]